MVTSTDSARPFVQPSSPGSGTDVLVFGAFLTLLVIGVVPAVAILTVVGPLGALVGALLTYGAVAVVTGNVAPGVVAAVPVLATVNADVPLRRGPNRTVDLGVVVGDAAVLAAAVLVVAGLYGARSSRSRSDRTRTGGVRGAWRTLGWPALFLAAFAGWALAGAAFAAHDPGTAAAFGVGQFRYVAYFAVAAGLVATDYANLRGLAGAFVVAVLGHAGFALAQFLHRGSLGLSVLGETVRDNKLTITLLGETMPIGRFLGGLVGNNAAFATLALPAVALLVWFAVRSDGLERRLALLGTGLLGLFCVPLSQYDSATVGFVVTAGLAAALASRPSWPSPFREYVERHRVGSLVASVAAVAAAVAVIAAVGVVRVLEVLPLVGPRNLDTRIADYRRAFELALEYPVFGYGGGNVESVGAELGFSGDLAIHSVVFSYLAETGFVGLALWLGAVLTSAVAAVRLAWSDHRDAGVAAALCVGAIGFFVMAMLDQVWDNHTSMGVLWLFAGAIVASWRRY